MTEQDKVVYLPFHAVNQFMRDDYRLTIIHEVFGSLDQCTSSQRQVITRLFTKGVTIQGFRNSSQAPLPIRIKHSPALFEKSAEFAATIMECWSNLHPELKTATYQLLSERSWNPQPVELDRSLLPGFLTDWPKSDTFEVLMDLVHKAKPQLEESDDNISLMVVWVGNRLPYNLYSDDEEAAE
jgi:hypothetical protein